MKGAKMVSYMSQSYGQKYLGDAQIKILLGVYLVFGIHIHQANSQDLVLSDLMISTTESYSSSNSITAGPDFTITNIGNVTLSTATVYLTPQVFVVEGGQLRVILQDETTIDLGSEEQVIPKKIIIHQNYPNPFNPSTSIEFSLPKPENVNIEVYNTLGQIVETLLNQHMKAGNHEVEFNAQNLSSGIYYYRFKAGEFQDVKKMVVIK
jgi:hypothetical protein